MLGCRLSSTKTSFLSLNFFLTLFSFLLLQFSQQTAEDVRVALEKAPKSDIKAAWDKVSSLSASAAGAVFQLSEEELAARSVAADKILEDYCSANPDADECRVYDD